MEPDLNYRACRNLISTMLLFALRDAAYGRLSDRIEASRWIAEDWASKHWAELLGIKKWPPGEDCYKRLRQEYQQRVINARSGKVLQAIAN